MSLRKFAYLVVAASLITTVIQALVFAPQLPNSVASHFGAGGAADDKMGKGVFLALMVGLQFGLTGMLAGLAILVDKFPPSMLNIPNREYWLADERREDSIRSLQDTLTLIAGITAVLIVFVFQLTISANLKKDPELNIATFLTIQGIYLVCISVICGRLILRFNRVPRDRQNQATDNVPNG